MLTAGQFCSRKIVTAIRTDLLLEVMQRIREEHVGCAIVVDERPGLPRRPIGVLTEHDILAHALSARGRGRVLRASDVVRPVQPVLASDSTVAALRVMRSARVRHLAVVDERGIMRGVVAFADIRAFLCALAPEAGAQLAPERAREASARDTIPVRRRQEPERG